MNRFFDFALPLAAAAACLTGLALGFTVVRQHKQLADQSVAVERRTSTCLGVRLDLEHTRAAVIDPEKHSIAAGAYRFTQYMRDDWQMINMCASNTLYVGASCAPDDKPCKLHALDWALVNIR